MHQFGWLAWSNPLAVWWAFLILVSAGNVAALLGLFSRSRRAPIGRRSGLPAAEPLLALGAVYVLGCAFRSILPRADVQRICLFDTWLSSVFVGRSVATAAEICFIVQWAMALRMLADVAAADAARGISRIIVPLVVLAEAFSWYAVITTNYLGNVLENSLWTAIFLLVAIALLDLIGRYRGLARLAIGAATVGIAGYVAFMCTVDLPMYVARWQAELRSGRPSLGLLEGLHDVATRWVVAHDVARWTGEIAWMSLYFSAAVWMSLLLAGFGLVRHALPRYCVRQLPQKPDGGSLSAAARMPAVGSAKPL